MTDTSNTLAPGSTIGPRRRLDLAGGVSSRGPISGMGPVSSKGLATMSDDMLLDELRRNARVSIRRIRADFVEVHARGAVLGYVNQDAEGFSALRGDDPAWAEEIGRYPSESLAVEALRMRRA